MVFMVAEDMSNASGSLLRSPEGSRMPADSMAMSEPRDAGGAFHIKYSE